MTEVTRENFEQVFPEMEKLLQSCNFISIDAEYTGLHAEEITDSNSLFDSPETRYLKLKEKVVGRFSINQIGIAFYQKNNEDPQHYFCNAYNVFVFPVSFDAFAKREVITLQVSCLNFLSKNGFDFNKYVKDGVPYLNKEKKDSLVKWLNTNRHFMNTCEDLETYFPKRIEYLSDKNIQEIVQRFEGFSKFIRLMGKHKKPVVGHNMLLDIMMIYNQFVAELPESYGGFKNAVHELFPRIFDTKCVAYGIGTLRKILDPDDRILRDTNLFSLYTNVSALLQDCIKPIIVPQNDSVIYNEALCKGIRNNLVSVPTAKCHTAAFDAAVTGGVFLKLGFLATQGGKSAPIYKQKLPPTMTEILKRVSQWENEVNIVRCLVSHIHFSESDPPSTRPDWIRVLPGKNQTYLDPMKLRGQLLKYGDIEIRVVRSNEIHVACGGFACHRKVWTDLQQKGYLISPTKPPSWYSERISLMIKYGASVICLSSVMILWYRWHRKL